MPILWSEEYLTDVRIIPILTQRDIGVDRTLALRIWLIENIDFAFVFSPWHNPSKLGLCSSGLSKTFLFTRNDGAISIITVE